MTRQIFRLAIAMLTSALVAVSLLATGRLSKPEAESSAAASPSIASEAVEVEKDKRHVVPDSLSPYEIARVVSRSGEQMKLHRTVLEVDLGWTWKQWGMEPSYFATCAGDCEATIFTHELDGEPGEEVLLKLTKFDQYCRYVLFEGGAADGMEPKLIGHVDEDLNKYEMSTHRIVNTLGKNWLVIRAQGGSGSGFSLYGETWYEVRKKSLRRVLHYPESGQSTSWPRGASRYFEAKVAVAPHPTEELNAKSLLTIRYSVSYSLCESRNKEEALLYDNEHQARYVWNKKKREFVFDAKRSDIEQDEIFAIAGYEDPELKVGSYDLFFKYNLESLLKVARASDGECKEWLREFIRDYSDTPAREALLKALND